METLGQVIGYAIAYPLVGMLVMLVGHTVGEIVMDRSKEGAAVFASKYFHLAGVGFVVHAVVTQWSGN